MKQKLVETASLLGLCIFFCSCAYHTNFNIQTSSPSKHPVTFSPGENPYAKLFFREYIPILVYKTSDPYKCGYGAGLLLAPQIMALHAQYIAPLMKMLDAAPPSCTNGCRNDVAEISYFENLWSERVKPLLVYNFDLAPDKAHNYLLERAKLLDIPNHFLVEMQGIVDGVNDHFSYRNDPHDQLTLEDLIIAHLFLDSFKRMGMIGSSSAFGCCAIATVGPCGTLLGRNLDWPNVAKAKDIRIGDYSIVTVRREVPGAHKVASVNFPGMVGTLSGINEKGVCVAVCESGASIAADGKPYMLAVRSLLGAASSVQEAEAILRKMQCASSFNLTVADLKHAATFQIDPQASEAVKKIKLRDNMVHATNHFVEGVNPEPILGTASDPSSIHRYKAIQSLYSSLTQEPCHEEKIKQCLHRACKRDTIQAIVMEPQRQRIRVAFGPGWTALCENADYVEIDCKLLFDKIP